MPSELSREPGTRVRKPTMHDVADRAGVSRTLVSFVMSGKPGASEETRKRILDVAAEIGYKPDTAAQLLARGRSRTLGVLVDLRQPFQAELVTRIYPIARSHGYEVLLSARAPERDEEDAIESMLAHRCEGLILLGPSADSRYLDALEERAVVVVVGKSMPPARFDSVRSADASGIQQSVDHLVRLGHRVIHHIGGGSAPGADVRRDAYLTTMLAHGLGQHSRVIEGDHDEATGIAAGRQMIAERSLPTAVLAGNDRCAVGLMDALDRGGVLVPDDVSIVGYDDSDIARLSRIDLTTVRQNVDDLAKIAVESAVKRLKDNTAGARNAVVEPQLIVRSTTARPRSARRDGLLERHLTV